MPRDFGSAPGDDALIERLRDLMIAVGWHHPHFLPFFSEVRLVIVGADHPVIQTYAIDMFGHMYVNRAFAATLTDAQTKGVLAHEVLHPALLHHQRRLDRDPRKWNRAADRAINVVVEGCGLELPPCALFPAKDQELWTAEQLYEEEPTPSTVTVKLNVPGGGKQPGAGKGQGDGEPSATAGCGMVDIQPEAPDFDKALKNGEISSTIDAQGNVTYEINGELARQLADRWAATAAQSKALAAGAGKGDMMARLLDPPEPRVDWSTILRNGFGEAAAAADREDVTWQRRSRRSGTTGAQLPGWQSFRAIAAVVIDASGSVDDASLTQAVAETCAIGAETQTRVFLVVHDDGVQFAGWIEAGVESVKACIKGRGGTTFDAAYRAVADEAIVFDKMIHLTDGGCFGAWPAQPANCKEVVVALLGHFTRDLLPPYAHTVEIVL